MFVADDHKRRPEFADLQFCAQIVEQTPADQGVVPASHRRKAEDPRQALNLAGDVFRRKVGGIQRQRKGCVQRGALGQERL